MKVQFLGAAQTVTGSCYMVEAAGKRFCIDCGMHQGNKAIEARNRETELYKAPAIDFILVTHAHIDHSGLLPKIVKEGFAGPIFCTKATSDTSATIMANTSNPVDGKNVFQAKNTPILSTTPTTAPDMPVSAALSFLLEVMASM